MQKWLTLKDAAAIKEYSDDYKDLEKRVGKFAVIFNKGETLKNRKLRYELSKIFETIIVIGAYPLMEFDQIQYICLCEQFEPIEIGENVPAYRPIFTYQMEDGIEKITNVEWESAK